METLTLNSPEQQRLLILNRVLAGDLTATQAAVLLDRSVRQVRRLLAAYRQDGAAALAHGNRGRPSAHALPPATRQAVLHAARATYAGCNHSHLTDLLAARDDLHLSRSSVRRILLAAGERSPRRRRAPAHRARRARYPQAGQLLQLDASTHPWLEARGPRLSLLAAIDDATGAVPFALFREHEDTAGYLELLRGVVGTLGRPLAVYHDQHSIFRHTGPARLSVAEQLAGAREPTQFGRLLRELEITAITAHSPQAKGRIERLWGTWQERLVVELRLADARTREQANAVVGAYLPRFNAQFAVPAAQAGSAYRPLAAGVDLEQMCCFKYERVVGADNTVPFGERRLQLLASATRRSWARARVEVQERLDGRLVVYYQGAEVASAPAPAEAPRLRARKYARSGGGVAASAAPGSAGGAAASAEREPAAPEGAAGGPERAAAASGGGSRPRASHPWRRATLARG
jgi:transposase